LSPPAPLLAGKATQTKKPQSDKATKRKSTTDKKEHQQILQKKGHKTTRPHKQKRPQNDKATHNDKATKQEAA
jgi:hypothetical protein